MMQLAAQYADGFLSCSRNEAEDLSAVLAFARLDSLVAFTLHSAFGMSLRKNGYSILQLPALPKT